MTLDEEEKLFKNLKYTLPSIVAQVIENGESAIETMESLIKEAVYVFSKTDYLSTLALYNKICTSMGTLIAIAIENDETYDNTMKCISVVRVVEQIDKLFGQIHMCIDSFNDIVKSHKVNIEKFHLSKRLMDTLDFDVINYEDLEEACKIEYPYLVMRVEDPFDRSDDIYSDFNVLRLNAFKTKAEVNRFCLENGISRDFILHKYK